MYYYYKNDPKLIGLSNELLYEIKYVYKKFNGKVPLSIYRHVLMAMNIFSNIIIIDPGNLHTNIKSFWTTHHLEINVLVTLSDFYSFHRFLKNMFLFKIGFCSTPKQLKII